MKYREQVNIQTGEKRWVPVQGEMAPQPQPVQEKQIPWEPGAGFATNVGAQVQSFLGRTKTLPAVLGTTGGVLGRIAGGKSGSAAGSGIGVTAGTRLQQMSKRGGPESFIATEEEGKEALQAGASAAIVDFLVGQGLDLAGKTAKGTFKVTAGTIKGLQKFLGIPEGAGGRQMLSNVLQPSKGQIAKDLSKEGISETLEWASKNEVKGNARQIFTTAKKTLKGLWPKITKFLSTNADELPNIEGINVVSAIDDEIANLNRLGKTSQADELFKLKEGFSGSYGFEDFYKLTKSWGEEARSVYQSGKEVIDVKPYMTKAYKLLNDTGRRELEKQAGAVGFTGWAKMMDDYHNWSNVEAFAESGTAAGQTKITSLRALLTRFLEHGIPVVKKIGAGGKKLAAGGVAVAKSPTVKDIGLLLQKFLSQQGAQAINEEVRTGGQQL